MGKEFLIYVTVFISATIYMLFVFSGKSDTSKMMRSINANTYGELCSEFNKTEFTSCPFIAVILPVTSNGNKIDEINPDPSQLLLMNLFYPSFIETIEPYSFRFIQSINH